MPILTISQNLPRPAGLRNGQPASAEHIIPLYQSLNAFNFPLLNLGLRPFGQIATAQTIPVGLATPRTFSLPNIIRQDKAFVLVLFHGWSVTAGDPRLQVVFGNTTFVTGNTGSGIGVGASGGGITFCLVPAGRDADVANTGIFFAVSTTFASGATFTTNTDNPPGPVGSFGLRPFTTAAGTGTYTLTAMMLAET